MTTWITDRIGKKGAAALAAIAVLALVLFSVYSFQRRAAEQDALAALQAAAAPAPELGSGEGAAPDVPAGPAPVKGRDLSSAAEVAVRTADAAEFMEILANNRWSPASGEGAVSFEAGQYIEARAGQAQKTTRFVLTSLKKGFEDFGGRSMAVYDGIIETDHGDYTISLARPAGAEAADADAGKGIWEVASEGFSMAGSYIIVASGQAFTPPPVPEVLAATFEKVDFAAVGSELAKHALAYYPSATGGEYSPMVYADADAKTVTFEVYLNNRASTRVYVVCDLQSGRPAIDNGGW